MTKISRTLAALALGVLGASAYAAAPTGPSCTASTVTTGNPGYIACLGATGGNLTESALSWGADSFAYLGKTEAGSDAGPFGFVSGANSGTITFDTPQTGIFVVGIKAGDWGSYYKFDGGVSGISSLAFDTLGVATNVNGIGLGVSHLNLYSNTPVPNVPEPETYALLLGGLGLVGFVARRRRQA